MNIFYIDEDPQKCAQAHVDKHVVKMIIEYCQLLSMAVWTHDLETAEQLNLTKNIYNAPGKNGKHAHFNHPSAIWVRQSRQHFDWLLSMTGHLIEEYRSRYSVNHGRDHRSFTECYQYLKSNDKFPDNGWIAPPQCMPDECKGNDSLLAYRKLYREVKIRFAKYTNRDAPEWLKDVYDSKIDAAKELQIQKLKESFNIRLQKVETRKQEAIEKGFSEKYLQNYDMRLQKLQNLFEERLKDLV